MKATVRYSFVKVADKEAIISLYKAAGWWHEEQAERDTLPLLVRNSFCFMVAKDASGNIIGMGRAISDGVSDAYIQDVFVKESCRKQGIGRQIILRIKGYCLRKGLTWIGLIAQPGTSEFYKKLGFAVMDDYTPMLFIPH